MKDDAERCRQQFREAAALPGDALADGEADGVVEHHHHDEEQERSWETFGDDLGDRPAAPEAGRRKGGAEVEAGKAPEIDQKALVDRAIESQALNYRLPCFGWRLRIDHHRGDVAGHHLEDREHRRDDQHEQHDALAETPKEEPGHSASSTDSINPGRCCEPEIPASPRVLGNRIWSDR